MLGKTLLLLLSLACLAGCGRVERARQCRALAQTVNPRLVEVRQLTEGAQQPPSLRSAAERYDGIADELGPLEFQSKSLAEAVQEYGRQLRALATEARKAAEAVETKDPALHQTTRREVRLRTGQLRAAQHRIEDICRQ